AINKIIQIAGESRHEFKAFNLRPYSPHERCEFIEYIFKLYGEFICYAVIDGIADLSIGINDEDEASRVSTMLLRLTKIYNCHISTVIHQNKQDNYATGHLGSAIMKKAEIIISVSKPKDRGDYLSEVVNEMGRGIDFKKFVFCINPEGLPQVEEDIQEIQEHFSEPKNNKKEIISEPVIKEPEQKEMPF
ncbi:MAG: hypothetical protein V1904_06245, partial [Bacteroidota bacterium]